MGLSILTAVAASCDSSGMREPAVQVRDSLGVQIVENSAPQWEDGGPTIEREPRVNIGREGGGPYQFAFVTSAVFTEGGAIAVADAGTQDVRVFDPSGAHLMTFGGPGDGPGEFRGLSVLLDYAGDSLAAFDARRRRTTVFSTSSAGHRTIQNGVEGNYEIFGWIPEGVFLLFSPGGSYRPDLPPGLQWVRTQVVAMDAESATSHVIATLPDRWRDVGPDGNAPMPQPLMHAAMAVGEDGFYWGTPDRYEFRYFDPEGSLRRIVRRPGTPATVTPSMIDAFIETELGRVSRFQGDEAVPGARRRLESEAYGDYVPQFQTVFVDRVGRLWVGSSDWPSSQPPSKWSVFSPEGRWLGDLDAPDGLKVMDATGDRVLGVWRDDLDVQHVRVHRLVG